MDANDYKSKLQKHYRFGNNQITLYNKSMNMNTCCEDAGYSMPGDYVFDTLEASLCRYMVPYENKYEQCFGDHLGLYYETSLRT